MGNQPKTTTRVARLGIGQGGIDVPFCAGRLLCSRFAHCSADPMNSGEVVVEHVEALGLSVVSFFLFRLGGGASGANFVVTSHALKKSETVKHHTTHTTTHTHTHAHHTHHTHHTHNTHNTHNTHTTHTTHYTTQTTHNDTQTTHKLHTTTHNDTQQHTTTHTTHTSHTQHTHTHNTHNLHNTHNGFKAHSFQVCRVER